MLRYLYGKVGEWLKSPLSKSGRPERVSRVQIPPFPQEFRDLKAGLSEGEGGRVAGEANRLRLVTKSLPFR